ncbi:VOC family protein [Streptomyces yaizuensis]|uniref:VOC family protein n=1 Tax=Streptomyces yaizuensis TaxID=2989713 RepID=A0ABQ5P313_9ACTN|nr:VOC family protein [Streptomyces sp. YSPA8]GLF96993.1 VOC family protein [Streptomyces sp. YSPA8]
MTVAKTPVLVLDCAEPRELAEFYAALLGARARQADDPDFVEVVGGSGILLAIHRDPGHAPPSWPRPENSLQAHLRVLVDREDLDEAEREAVGLGAVPVETGDRGGPGEVRLYADPAGHSFSFAVSPARSAR